MPVPGLSHAAPAIPAPPPAVPAPPAAPQLPSATLNPNYQNGFHHGVSLLHGWLPVTVEVVVVVVLVVAIARRTRRWWTIQLPLCVLLGVVGALVARWYVTNQGLASDPAPVELWAAVGATVGALAVAVLGWRGARWWRRGVALLAVPLAVLSTGIVLNQWVGYYPTVESAWSALTAGPLPHQTDLDALDGLRGTDVSTGKVVPVDIPDSDSGFPHRTEYVYLPPAWFAGPTPPTLPVVMMIGGEFNTPADWLRSGQIMPAIDSFTAANGGRAPILVFVDSSGSFNNDTECVNGPRGDAADHLTRDVPSYLASRFHASTDPAQWAVVGWSMGGTCAVDLAVMHPELVRTFVDIAGDLGPTSGTKDQTIARLFGGNAAQWAAFDPLTVMAAHGQYTGTAGLFDDLTPPHRPNYPGGQGNHRRAMDDENAGMGGRDGVQDAGEVGAAEKLCTQGREVGIDCTIHTTQGGHTWQFAAAAFTSSFPWIVARLGLPIPTNS
ncbi:alpha/beta hydrolase-fold protein [Nocardia sp. NPDC049149]|uniref:alpha/beta hydrolase-fold protein n=1 Tax=Nocardia sp. NPDC049149 TaxID=3364315 RepID=UPI003716A382